MVKYYFSNLLELAKALAYVSDDKASTVITIGAKANDTQLSVQARSTSLNRQIAVRAVCDKPKSFDGNAVQIAVKTAAFTTIVNSLSSFKDEKMFIAVGEKEAQIGVTGKASVKLDLLTDTPAEIKAGNIMARFTSDGSFESLLRKGAGCASQSVDESTFLHNAVLVLDTVSGKLSAVSTDAVQMARAKTDKIEMVSAPEGNEKAAKEIEEMKKALNAYCEASTDVKQTPEALTLYVPNEAVQIVRQITSGAKKIGVAVDETHLIVQVGQFVTLTISRGTKSAFNPAAIDGFFSQQGAVTVGIDQNQLLQGLSLCNKMAGLSGSKEPLSLEVAKDVIKASVGTGKTKVVETKIPFIAKEGETVSVLVNGKQLEAAINLLDKGGVVLTFVNDKVVLASNGSIADGKDENAGIGLALIKPNAAETTEETVEEAEALETDEAVVAA